ncbi:hypothetical protein [Tahibacter sp.]|uniref:hypothetical protein n=1 Tax=Tahibacter sp. TaxID=2056211 RepID=UPI0028C493AE|nr:hypothetical protein [Tahibacter sp.]
MSLFNSLLQGLLAISVGPVVEPTFGRVDGYAYDAVTQNLIVQGWVCQRNNASAIDVHIYAGGPLPAGTLVAYQSPANGPPEYGESFPGCGGNTRRFAVPITPAMRTTYAGQTLYAYAYPAGSNWPLLDGSGELRVPHRISAAIGDGVTDDTDTINSEIALGGVTYVPRNAVGKNYLVTDRCIVPGCETSPSVTNKDRRVLLITNTGASPAPVEVILDGTLFLASQTNSGSTGVVPADTRQIGVIQVADNSKNVTISGRGVIDGNRVNQDECCIGGVVAGGPTLGPYSTGIQNLTVRGLTIRNTYNWPVSIDGADGVTLRDLKIIDGGNSVQFAHGTTNAHAYNLRVEDIRDIGFAFYNNVSHSSIENSTVQNSDGAGIGVLSDDPLPADVGKPLSHHITISGNQVHRSRGGVETLNANTSGGFTSMFSNVTINSNKVYGSLMHNYGVNSCLNCSVTGNLSEGSGTGGKDITQIGRYLSGLFLSESQNVSISNNTFSNEGQGEGGIGYGAILYPDANDNTPLTPGNDIATSGITFSGNTFVDLQATGTMAGRVSQSPPTPVVYSISNSTDCGVLAPPYTCVNVP